MKTFSQIAIICLVLLVRSSFSAIFANFKITSYHPPNFELNLTQNVTRPKFQILLNNQNLDYAFTDGSSQTTVGSLFKMEVTNGVQPNAGQLQIYTLRFNQPLDIGDGSLSLNNFLLRAQKGKVKLPVDYWVAIIYVIFIYLSCFIDVGGLWIIEFVQLFILQQITGEYTTIPQKALAGYLLLNFPLDASQVLSQQKQREAILLMLAPIIIVTVPFFIGIICKFLLSDAQHIVTSLLRNFFTFRFYIMVSIIFSINFVVNGVGFANTAQYYTGMYYVAGIILACLGFIYWLVFVIASGIILNPCWLLGKSNEQSWNRYIKNDELFLQFGSMHNNLLLDSWQTRNWRFLLLWKKTIVAIVTVLVRNFDIVMIVFQTLHFFYIFTMKPYKQMFYNYVGMVIQLLVVIFYFYIFQSNLYFEMSPEILTHNDIGYFQATKDVIFTLFCFAFLFISCYEAYEKIVQYARYISQKNNSSSDQNGHWKELQQISNTQRREQDIQIPVQPQKRVKQKWDNQKSLFEQILVDQ